GRAGRVRGGPRALARRAPAARPVGRPEDDRAPGEDRRHPGADCGTCRIPRAHAERGAVRPRAGAMRRAVVTLGHPGHAGMLRALRALDEAAPRHGWRRRFVLSEPHPLVAKEGLPAERTTFVPALGRWRTVAGRLALPAAVARLARLARDADLLYACTLSSFPHCFFAGRLARRPQIAHVHSSSADGRPSRKPPPPDARAIIAPSAAPLALAARALGGFRPGPAARVVYNGVDVARLEREGAAPVPADLGGNGVPRVGMVGNLDRRK